MQFEFYDTLQREIVSFNPIEAKRAGLYSCGPTVYDYAHIGNLRTYLFVDILKRTLSAGGYTVKHVMNITDVGHLVSDGDTGEDKMEKGSRLAKQSAWEIAKRFESHFFEDLDHLNIIHPEIICRATEHIAEQIEYIVDLERKGFTYINDDGVYFDTSKIDQYGYLARLNVEGLQAGKRVSYVQKRNITDFALWKFSGATTRQMEWHSPWGIGFPGWHIECSAMAEKYLGPLFDIHVGGEDHIPVHHSNEIAQTQGRHGTQLANYWMHGYFLQIDNEKVAKSGKSLTLATVIEAGFDPLSYRYLVLTAHYRSRLNFSWSSITAAQNTLKKLRKMLGNWEHGGVVDTAYVKKFHDFIDIDLNTPRALALMWDMLGGTLPTSVKRANVIYSDQIFGLQLDRLEKTDEVIPEHILTIAEERKAIRQEKDWATSDILRDKISELGFVIEDEKEGYTVRKK